MVASLRRPEHCHLVSRPLAWRDFRVDIHARRPAIHKTREVSESLMIADDEGKIVPEVCEEPARSLHRTVILVPNEIPARPISE
jgi:hypothetical protein